MTVTLNATGKRASRRHRTRCIETTRESVGFNPLYDYRLDVEDFLTHLDIARAHAHEALAGCETCLSHLEQAVALYRGDFLEDLSIGDSVAFEEWALIQRERLRRGMLEALEQLATAHLERGSYTTALAYAHRQLEFDPWHEPAHRQTMQALALDGQRTAALAHYENCRETLLSDLNAEPEPATTALFESIRDGAFRAIHAPLRSGALPPAPGTTPFMGLRFFDVADADRFFGREALTRQLVDRLVRGERFLAIVGASGSGKSSLVRAGVVAGLQTGKRSGTPLRAYSVFTPTADPLNAAALALATLTGATDATLPDRMMVDPTALSAFLRETRGDAGTEIVLVVDQFEELFTLCHDPRKRQAFIDNLLAVITGPSPAAVIIALRADFYHRCAQYEALRQGLATHQVYIGAMTLTELRHAILGPAQRYEWSLEPGLTDLMPADIGATPDHAPEPGALPLLSHALLETWKRRQGRTLTLAGYAAAGGIRGAIAQSAESVYRTLQPAEQAIARNVFLRLTEVARRMNRSSRWSHVVAPLLGRSPLSRKPRALSSTCSTPWPPLA